jgi:drug/metabolite transporter (DMT)-like permease
MGGLQSRRLPVLSVLLVSQPVGLAFALAIALIAGGAIGAGGLVAAAAGGAAGVLALGLFYAAMAIGPMSIIAPVASMGALVPVIVGLARGDSPTSLQATGIAVALIGIALAVQEAEHPHGMPVSRRAVALAAVSGIGFGAFFVGLDSAASEDPAWAIVAARSGGVVLILAAAAARPSAVTLSAAAMPALIVIGAFDIAANGLFAFATREGLLPLVSVAGSLYPISTIVLARIVLGERLASLQRLGVGFALAGVALIAGG